jgi:hypothetical protein
MSTSIFLGNEMKINGSNIFFNNANVSVKYPITNTNAVNKFYVDEVYSEIHSVMEEEISNRVTQNVELQTNINTLQSEIVELSNQLNSIYQYFLKRDRDVTIPPRV